MHPPLTSPTPPSLMEVALWNKEIAAINVDIFALPNTGVRLRAAATGCINPRCGNRVLNPPSPTSSAAASASLPVASPASNSSQEQADAGAQMVNRLPCEACSCGRGRARSSCPGLTEWRIMRGTEIVRYNTCRKCIEKSARSNAKSAQKQNKKPSLQQAGPSTPNQTPFPMGSSNPASTSATPMSSNSPPRSLNVLSVLGLPLPTLRPMGHDIPSASTSNTYSMASQVPSLGSPSPNPSRPSTRASLAASPPWTAGMSHAGPSFTSTAASSPRRSTPYTRPSMAPALHHLVAGPSRSGKQRANSPTPIKPCPVVIDVTLLDDDDEVDELENDQSAPPQVEPATPSRPSNLDQQLTLQVRSLSTIIQSGDLAEASRGIDPLFKQLKYIDEETIGSALKVEKDISHLCTMLAAAAAKTSIQTLLSSAWLAQPLVDGLKVFGSAVKGVKIIREKEVALLIDNENYSSALDRWSWILERLLGALRAIDDVRGAA